MTSAVTVAVGEGLGEGTTTGSSPRGAPKRIQRSMRASASWSNGGAPKGIRLPCPGAGPVSFTHKKLRSGENGVTRNHPASRAAAFCGATSTNSSYTSGPSKTKPPAATAAEWQGPSAQWRANTSVCNAANVSPPKAAGGGPSPAQLATVLTTHTTMACLSQRSLKLATDARQRPEAKGSKAFHPTNNNAGQIVTNVLLTGDFGPFARKLSRLVVRGFVVMIVDQ